MNFCNPRLRVPVLFLLLGSAVGVILGITLGWQPLIGGEVFVVAVAAGYYLWGGKDSDMGAIAASRPLDERQLLRRLKVQALVGRVMSLACVVAFTVALAAKATYWPFEILLLLVGVTFFGGWAYYRERA